jgi:branched-chain amino acid transport system permease protein
LLWFAVVVTWGIRSPVGALLGGVAIAVAPELITEKLPEGAWKQLPTILFGLGAIAVAREPRGVVVQVVENFRALGRRLSGALHTEDASESIETTGVSSP